MLIGAKEHFGTMYYSRFSLYQMYNRRIQVWRRRGKRNEENCYMTIRAFSDGMDGYIKI